jgi:hypothetical protein
MCDGTIESRHKFQYHCNEDSFSRTINDGQVQGSRVVFLPRGRNKRPVDPNDQRKCFPARPELHDTRHCHRTYRAVDCIATMIKQKAQWTRGACPPRLFAVQVIQSLVKEERNTRKSVEPSRHFAFHIGAIISKQDVRYRDGEQTNQCYLHSRKISMTRGRMQVPDSGPTTEEAIRPNSCSWGLKHACRSRSSHFLCMNKASNS